MFLGTVPLSFGDDSEKLIAHNEFFGTVPADSSEQSHLHVDPAFLLCLMDLVLGPEIPDQER